MPHLSQTLRFLQRPSFRHAQSALIGQLTKSIVIGRTPQAHVWNVMPLTIITTFNFKININTINNCISNVLSSSPRGEQSRLKDRYVFANKPRLCDHVSLSHTCERTHTHKHTHTTLRCDPLSISLTHTHTHTHVGFYGLRGLSIGVMVFILYKLYVLLPYTYPTPKLSPHRRRCISTFPKKNLLCMIYKHFELWGHWKCPHKSPSPMSYQCHYTNLCPHKPHKHAHTHTHTHTHTQNAALWSSLSLSLSLSHTHTQRAKLCIWTVNC